MPKEKIVTRYIVLLDDGAGRIFLSGNNMTPRLYREDEPISDCKEFPLVSKIKVLIPERFVK
jgi:hypothetical protein